MLGKAVRTVSSDASSTIHLEGSCQSLQNILHLSITRGDIGSATILRATQKNGNIDSDGLHRRLFARRCCWY